MAGLVGAGVLIAVALALAVTARGIQRGQITPPRVDMTLGSLHIRAGSQITCLSGFRHDCDGPYFVVAVQVLGARTPANYTLIRAPIAQPPAPDAP